MLRHGLRGLTRLGIVAMFAATCSAVIAPAARAALPTPKVTSLSVTTSRLSGAVRTVVRGGDFAGVRAVIFGSTPGTALRLLSPGAVLVTAPAHVAGAVQVRVVTTHGTSAKVAADIFRYIPPPKVVSVDLPSGGAIPGTAITIHGGPFIHLRAVRFGTTLSPAVRVLSSSAISATMPSNLWSSSAPVTVADAYGISPSFPVPVDQNRPPALSVSATSVQYNDVRLAIVHSANPSALPLKYDHIKIIRMYATSSADGNQSDTLAILPAATTAYDDTTAEPNMAYTYYAVPTLSGTDEMPYTTALAQTPAPPGAPVPLLGAEVLLHDATHVALTWQVDFSADIRYHGVYAGAWIRRMSGPNGAEFPLQGTPVTPVTGYGEFIDPTASPNTQYTYSIFPYASNGAWAAPSYGTVTTPAAGVGFGQRQVIDRVFGNPKQISCTSTTFCAAVDSNGAVLTYDGKTWSSPVLVDPSNKLASVSCTSASLCLAASIGGIVYSYDGSGWSSGTSVDPLGTSTAPNTEISCGSSTFCMASFDGANYSFNGTSWSAAPSLPNSEYLTAVSCRADGACDAGSGSGDHFRLNGSSWGVADPTGASRGIASLSCPTATFCAAVDYGGGLFTWQAGVWAPRIVAGSSSSIAAVSCATATRCDAVPTLATNQTEPHVSLWRWNGSSWGGQVVWDPSTKGYDATASCVAGGTCFLLDGGGNSATDDGTNQPALTSADPNIGGMYVGSCALSGTCTTVDNSSTFTVISGMSGAHSARPQTGFYLASLSCPTTNFCAALDQGNQLTTYVNGVWGTPFLVGPDTRTTHILGGGSISCASATLCLAYVYGGVWHYDGAKWTQTSTPGGLTAAPTGTQCAQSMCMVVFGDGSGKYDGVYRYDGSTWTETASVRTFNAPVTDPWVNGGEIACTSDTFCMMTSTGDYSTWDGASWTRHSGAGFPPRDGPSWQLACASAQLCIATGQTYHAAGTWIYDGSRWAGYAIPDQGDRAITNGCFSAGQCVVLSPDSAYVFSE